MPIYLQTKKNAKMQTPKVSFTLKNKKQNGVALFVVLVFVMLTMLLATWASRTSFFNELVMGNDADYQRAFEAAQALIQDAELDIRNERADGGICTGTDDVCRTNTAFKIPLENKDIGPLLAALENQTPTFCAKGLCAKRLGKQDFWNNSTAANGPTLAQMTSTGVGARYGDFTGATLGTSSTPANPILMERAEGKGGWYWIEVLPYDESSKMSHVVLNGSAQFLPMNLIPNVAYRITAIAYGRKPTKNNVPLVVIQQTYAQQKLKD